MQPTSRAPPRANLDSLVFMRQSCMRGGNSRAAANERYRAGFV
jgi:hypothetical protein